MVLDMKTLIYTNTITVYDFNILVSPIHHPNKNIKKENSG
jgi:hypothetical protein